jgi:catechol 2,3-dioxygenase-like lactoylglutathione lyase family enzyme
MPLHRLSSFTYEVPDVDVVASYYEEFGLSGNGDGSFSTTDGGRQLYLRRGNTRRIAAVTLGADDPDDLERISSNLRGLGFDSTMVDGRLVSKDPVTQIEVVVDVEGRVLETPRRQPPTNTPGDARRVDARAEGARDESRVTPRRLGHVVVGSVDAEQSVRFFVDGLGFKVSDRAGVGAFLRCSTDHHNLLVMPAPVNYPHHSSWQVDNIDAIGRGAMDMLEGHPERHVWGPGRHYAGSNFFWYLKDPAGTFSEYYSDMDCIVDDSLWNAEAVEGLRGLFRWGPMPSPSFLEPEDLAAMMTGAHSA